MYMHFTDIDLRVGTCFYNLFELFLLFVVGGNVAVVVSYPFVQKSRENNIISHLNRINNMKKTWRNLSNQNV